MAKSIFSILIHKSIKLIALLLMITSVQNLYADSFEVDGFYFDVLSQSERTCQLTGGDKQGDLVIPSTVNYNGVTYTVTEIKTYTFSQRSKITSVTIPNSVMRIGAWAFYDCDDLEHIVIEDGDEVLTFVDWGIFTNSPYTSLYLGRNIDVDRTNSSGYWFPFWMLKTLREVAIGSSVTEISSDFCSECSSLEKIVVENGNPYYDSREDCNAIICTDGDEATLILGCKNTHIPNSVTAIGRYAFRSTCPTSVTIPNSVITIGDGAFRMGESLESVMIGNSVTTIGTEAFYGCSSLVDVTIGNSVTTIGNSAFSGCSSLVDVTIGNSVTTIGYGAFGGCSSLVDVTIGNSVSTIGQYAFSSCSSLTYISIPSSVTEIGDAVFYGCPHLAHVVIEDGETELSNIYFYNSPITSVYLGRNISGNPFSWRETLQELTIGNMVTEISNQAFSGCSGLTELTIPNSVTSIGDDAFWNCSGLTELTIGNSVTSIGYSAFRNCSSLMELTIPNSVTSIGDWAFSDCSGLTGQLTIPNSVTSIGYSAFSGCSGLTKLTIGNSVTSIGDYAFQDCSGLTELTIGNSVTSIGDWAFSGCSGLTNLTLGNSVATIGNYAFYNCSDFTSLTIPSSVTSIGGSAFRNCSNLKSVIIPNSVTVIEGYTFQGCSSLTDVTIGNSVSTIMNCAFDGCSSLESISIPSSVTEIEYYAFSNCSQLSHVVLEDGETELMYGSTGSMYAFDGCPIVSLYLGRNISGGMFQWKQTLQELTIGNSVTRIGGFYGCRGLTNVEIPNSVTTISGNAFGYCSGLTSMEIPNSVTTIGNYAFGSCSGLTSVTISESITEISNQAFSTCTKLTSIIIPDGVTKIGEKAFEYCYSLKDVTLGKSVAEIGDDAFLGCSCLDTLYSYSPIPPSVASTSAFSYYHYNTLNVLVPLSILEDYRNASVWQDFLNLQGFIAIDAENFPDDNFRNYLLGQDYGTDEMLTSKEMEAVKTMDVSEQDISSVEGLRYFTALTSLSCYGNQIKDESMDNLISSLPQNTTDEEYPLYVYREGDGNVCTMAQVAAAKEKGWTPYYYDGESDSWLEYAGSDAEPDDEEEMPDDGDGDDTDGIDAVHAGKDAKEVIYTINGVKVSTTNVSDLPKGIYIVNGKKVVVK